jgi:hypothetical protein
MNKMKGKCLGILVSVGLVALLLLAPTNVALAYANPLAPTLGTAANFAVLAASAVTNTGPTIINGDLGISPNGLSSITGFPPGIVNGTIHAADAPAAQARTDALAAYNDLKGRTFNLDLSSVGLTGQVLLPGIYSFSSSAELTVGGTLILDANSDSNAVWIFQIGTSLLAADGSHVLVINGGSKGNVFWQVGTSATINTGAEFVGTIIADQSITLKTGAILYGRALALIAAVTMDTNRVAISLSPFSTPSLSQWGLILLVGLLVSVGFLTLRKQGLLPLG